MTNIHIERGDITEYAVDAIVNAANSHLILGGGLAGAIRTRGGPSIQLACTEHGPIKVGEAAITTAGNLKASYVIHQASMSLGSNTTARNLRSSIRAVLELAELNSVKTLALPATGTGIAGFPVDLCADIMLEEVMRHVANDTTLTDIYFVLYNENAYEMFSKKHAELGS